ncbi:hypothetical protein [Caulobacter sp. 1776]|uniref:hypothetical protein n=1 Tax=Caulobacter sp. 1776 TaxID=3156420 RepID=UPI003396337D
MNSKDWVFNERSMGTGRHFETTVAEIDTLLIGDSVVSGGNPYRQAERLGPQLENAAGGRVWPISANSWSVSNELAYLRANPDVVAKVDRLVFVWNSSDLRLASEWRTELTHPTHRPTWGLAYLVRRRLFSPYIAPRPDVDALPLWREFLASTGKPVTIVAFPSRAEAADPGLRQRRLIDQVGRLRIDRVKLIDIGADSRWGPSFYRDDLHPSPAGTGLLAQIVAENGSR